MLYRPTLALAALVALSIFVPTVLRADTAANTAPVTVGDPQKPELLAGQVQEAYQGGARNITITAGTYLLPKVGHSALVFDSWKDATISAKGVTLIMSDVQWNQNCLDLRNCSNVKISGPTLSQTEVTFYQGRVVSMGKEADGKIYADWKPDAGYPVPPDDAVKFPSGLNAVDAKTRRLKLGVGDYWNPPMEKQADGNWRIHFGDKVNFEVGDWFVGRYGGPGFKVHLDSCHDCTIQDVTMMRNGFANIREEGFGGGNHILSCKWVLGSKPEGATEEPLVTNAADGFHSTGANPGPDIENCSFEGILLDDCIAIHGSLQTIKSVAGNVLTVENGWAGLKVGEPARISNEKGFFAQTLVTDLKDNGDKTSTVTLDKDLGVPVGAKLSNPLVNGQGFKIIGCHVGGTRSRGILVKGDNGLIQNNVIDGCGMAGVSAGPEYYWGEADYVQNLRIEGNMFRGNGRTGWGGGAILVHGDGALGNGNISIKNNRFYSDYQGEMQIEWAHDVQIEGNTITGAPMWPAMIDAQTPVLLKNAHNVTLTGNTVNNASVYKEELLSQGENVEDVKSEGGLVKVATPVKGTQ